MPRPRFPKSLKEFREKFSVDQACWEYLWQSRWPEGYRCPNCSFMETWWIPSRHVYECKQCGLQAYPTAGTVMHGSHLPIQEWFWAAYLVSTHTPGLSAKQLQRQIGCSYKSAWFVLHRLRRSMINDARSPLYGQIEADETIIGGKIKGKRGRGVISDSKKSLVFGAVEVISYIDKNGANAEKAGRIRLAKTERADEESIKTFLNQNVAKGSIIRSDGWRGYSKTALKGYHHAPSLKQALHIHRAFGNLKTWLNGTYHGVSPKYLQAYLHEFVFRFNRRKTPMAAFQTLLGITTQKSHVTQREFVQPVRKG